MANLNPIASWSAPDVQHLARRAGFGISPEDAAALAAQPPGAMVDAWVDGTLAPAPDVALFQDVLATRADPVDEPARGTSPNLAPAVPGPHRYLVDGADAWRNSLTRAQASWAFRMQFNPYALEERMALFWHNLFATGHHKVDSAALMLNQIATLRSRALARFDDLHAAVSKDPAMAIWLDSVLNRADGSSVPNENYAREAMELYSLGADNGYNQQDITQLARALSGWSFTVPPSQRVTDPTDPNRKVAAGGTFRVYDGSPANGELLWNNIGAASAPANLPNRHGTGTVSFLGQSFDIAAPPSGMQKGEDALRSIMISKGPECAKFLASRLLTHFVTARFLKSDLDDLQLAIQSAGFDLRAVMKQLLKSQYFFDAANRFALVEGPVSWIVRAARALGPSLAAADGQSPKGFPAWALVAPSFDPAGMRLLDAAGPNGWKEDLAWVNSNTIRFRTKVAAAVALAETFTQGTARPIFPTDAAAWFPVQPATRLEVFDRLAGLLQPAAIPTGVRDAWLAALWAADSITWDAASQDKARELAFLILCSPASQLY
jgi:uncharacterized protein (DUF1800 family)